jgi:UDP-N-acetylglucosamine--N-acetylmuramyl-(pentapeptide) pyrophosphoryl-undecaprenol N-acetylglucosamine transferase
MACRFLGVPIVLHEANAVPGKAVSFLARFASAMAFGFPEAAEQIDFIQTVVTGFPVRADLESHFEDGLLDPDVFTILVMGGSQGSERLDKTVSGSICRLRERGMTLQVVHLARPENESKLRDYYRNAGVRCLVFGFLKEIGKAYCAADFVIARAGAATCAELSACGLPALLIPLPSARRDHQTANARSLEKRGCVDVIVEKDLSEEWLVDYVKKCAANPEKLSRMAQAQKECAVLDSAEKIAELVLTVGLNGERVNSGR